MSSPGSVVIADLPRWTAGERLSLVLAIACGGVVEAVLAHHPGVMQGPGLVLAILLLAGTFAQRLRRPASLEFGTHGPRAVLGDGRRVRFEVGPGTRLLGSSVVLHCRINGRTRRLWLTAADLPRGPLHRIALGVVAAAGACEPGRGSWSAVAGR
jgi:hypothetical protein